MELLSPKTLAIVAGLAIGLLFGAVGRWSAFCARGALEDAFTTEDAPRLRGYLLAVAVAVAGVQGLIGLGLIDVSKSFYLASAINISGALGGGFLFGIGMVMAGGCGARLLVLAGGGNLRALIALVVFALVAYATMRGVLAFVRVAVVGVGAIDPHSLGAADQSLTALFDDMVPAALLRWLLVGGLLVAIGAFVLRRRVAGRHLVGGLAVGLLVVAGFAATGILGRDDFEPAAVESLTVVRPLADTLLYLLTFTGASIDFGIATILAVPVGAFAIAWARGELKLEGFDGPRHMLRYMGGGALMGFGGVIAGGCTIGHGLTGAALLSPTSLLAIAAIAGGGLYALSRGKNARAAAPALTPGARAVSAVGG